jgi:hypothetical protein
MCCHCTPGCGATKQRDGLLLIEEPVNLFLSAPTDTTPAAHERRLAKQCRLDRMSIVASQVLAGVDALTVKLKQLLTHAGEHRLRQHPMSNDSFESIEPE